jgi:hypothetical protein
MWRGIAYKSHAHKFNYRSMIYLTNIHSISLISIFLKGCMWRGIAYKSHAHKFNYRSMIYLTNIHSISLISIFLKGCMWRGIAYKSHAHKFNYRSHLSWIVHISFGISFYSSRNLCSSRFQKQSN